MKDLLERKEAILKQLNAINAEIRMYKDKYEYAVVVRSYGNSFKYAFNNLEAALNYCEEYNQENGYAHLYTTNPSVKISLRSGDVYYVQDINLVDAKNHPKAISPEEYHGDESDNFLQ
jgi:hypothetical protein